MLSIVKPAYREMTAAYCCSHLPAPRDTISNIQILLSYYLSRVKAIWGIMLA